jgi:hypothetical protein
MTTISLATHTPPDKSQSREVFNANMRAAFAYEANLASQINTVAGEVNANALLATEKADVAVAKAEEAGLAVIQASDIAATVIGTANFAGVWNELTGPLTVPTSVLHNGIYWMLLHDIADVTLSEPGISGDWSKISFPPFVDLDALAQLHATALSF